MSPCTIGTIIPVTAYKIDEYIVDRRIRRNNLSVMSKGRKVRMNYIDEHRFFHEDEISMFDICKLSGKTLKIMVVENTEFALLIGENTLEKKAYLLRKIDKRKFKEVPLSMKYDNSNLECLRTKHNIPETSAKKPTKGVIPRFLWDETRLDQLRETISAKILNNEKLSFEWIEEYNYLIKYFFLKLV